MNIDIEERMEKTQTQTRKEKEDIFVWKKKLRYAKTSMWDKWEYLFKNFIRLQHIIKSMPKITTKQKRLYPPLAN